MRVPQILILALSLGLVAGYAWSAMMPRRAHVRIPRAETAVPIAIPETAADKEWEDRAQEDEARPDDHLSVTGGSTSSGTPEPGPAPTSCSNCGNG